MRDVITCRECCHFSYLDKMMKCNMLDDSSLTEEEFIKRCLYRNSPGRLPDGFATCRYVQRHQVFSRGQKQLKRPWRDLSLCRGCSVFRNTTPIHGMARCFCKQNSPLGEYEIRWHWSPIPKTCLLSLEHILLGRLPDHETRLIRDA